MMQKSALYKLIFIFGCIILCGYTMYGKDNNDIELKHSSYISGNAVRLSGVEILGYNDFNGCKIADCYNIIDSCYMEIGDDKNIDVYHLAILSPDSITSDGSSLLGNRVLLAVKNGKPICYDNVISNQPAIYDNSIMPSCEIFFIPSEDDNNGNFNTFCDFELVYWGGQGYKIGWSIGVKAKDQNMYVVGLSFWEHNPGLTYQKMITFEYEVGEFPLEEYRRSMIEMVRYDKNPWRE